MSELGKHAQGEEYAASGHAASSDFLGDDTVGGDGDWESEAMRSSDGQPPPGEADSALPHYPVVPVQREGKPPRMAYFPWQSGGGVEMGAVSDAEWYWRCPVCRAWGGSFRASAVARQTGVRHRADEHDRPAARRAEARTAARRVCKDMTAARLDETVARLAAAHALEPSVVLSAVHRTADAIGWRSSLQDALFYTGRSLGTAGDGGYLDAPHPRVAGLVSAIAAELGHPGWLEERLAAEASQRPRRAN